MVLFNQLFVLCVLNWINAAASQAQDGPFLITFEGPQFESGQTTGRIENPVQQFNLSDFSVIKAQEIPADNNVPITSSKTSLLRPCSQSHYIVRIAPNTVDRTLDRGETVGLKIATGPDRQPLFRSFDLATICMGCVFVPALTQGKDLPEPLKSDPFSKVVTPASCDITLTGTKYSAPGSNEKTTITATVPFKANAPLSLSDPMTLRASDMGVYRFSNRWTDLISVEFRIRNVMVETPANVPSRFDQLLRAGGVFDSLALDNINGTKHPGAGGVAVP
ncbi:hypothetical protein TWF281_007465 [Arthrobotrys megalospora]